MEDAQSQLTDKLKTANNILVTVSRNPSVDQLSALLGLTLLLNKQGKHAAAVFSGEVPSAIEFLDPASTIEKNTDSLRDFIIALDKNKADKLRYKVEDNVVRIFITPYKTSIKESDFEFSQGDFNVDLVIALGVGQQEDLDEAIISHGRILHDATVASINIAASGGLGTINWHVPQASSLSELVTHLSRGLGDNLLDEQIATALLTGIVAETDRFRNEKTNAQSMSASSTLMAAGANQQLVAKELEQAQNPQEVEVSDSVPKDHDGSIDIEHEENEAGLGDEQNSAPALELPAQETEDQPPAGLSPGPKLVTEPPTFGGTLTANSTEPALEPSTDPLSMTPPPESWTPPATVTADPTDTIVEIEESVNSPHVEEEHEEQVDVARDEVTKALTDTPPAPSPIQALNSQPLGEDLRSAPEPANSFDPTPQPADPNAPPPVPPPIPFQFGTPSQNQQ